MVSELKDIEIFSQDGNKKGSLEIDISSLDQSKSERIISDVAIMYMANQKKHTASVKGRSEIATSTKKLRKQKGSGMARCGTASSPIWVGGGVAFGPRPRDVYYQIPKNLKRRALHDALLLKVKNGDLILIDDLKFEAVKTKAVRELLNKLNLEKSVLLVTDEINDNLLLSSRNLPKIAVTTAKDLNVYNILLYKKVIFTEKAFEALKDRLGLGSNKEADQ